MNVNLIRIMFGFWVSPTILNICSACELWESRPGSGCNGFNVSCVSLSPEVREILRSRQTPSQLQHSIDKIFSSFSDSPRLSLLHFDVTSISNIYESDSCLAWSSIIAELEGNFPLDWFPTSGTWGTESIWTQVKQCFRCHIFRRKVSRSRT